MDLIWGQSRGLLYHRQMNTIKFLLCTRDVGGLTDRCECFGEAVILRRLMRSRRTVLHWPLQCLTHADNSTQKHYRDAVRSQLLVLSFFFIINLKQQYSLILIY